MILQFRVLTGSDLSCISFLCSFNWPEFSSFFEFLQLFSWVFRKIWILGFVWFRLGIDLDLTLLKSHDLIGSLKTKLTELGKISRLKKSPPELITWFHPKITSLFFSHPKGVLWTFCSCCICFWDNCLLWWYRSVDRSTTKCYAFGKCEFVYLIR